MEKAAFVGIGALAVPMGFLARREEFGDFGGARWDPLIGLAWAVYSVGFYVWKTVGIGILGPISPICPDSSHPDRPVRPSAARFG